MPTLPPLSSKLTIAQLRPLQAFLLQHRTHHNLTWSAMAGQALGKGTLANICRTQYSPLSDDTAVPDDSPTWRLVSRIATTLNVAVEEMISPMLWDCTPASALPVPSPVPHGMTLAELVEQAEKAMAHMPVMQLPLLETQRQAIFAACLHRSVAYLQYYVDGGEVTYSMIHGPCEGIGDAFALLMVQVAGLAVELDIRLEDAITRVLRRYKEHGHGA